MAFKTMLLNERLHFASHLSGMKRARRSSNTDYTQ